MGISPLIHLSSLENIRINTQLTQSSKMLASLTTSAIDIKNFIGNFSRNPTKLTPLFKSNSFDVLRREDSEISEISAGTTESVNLANACSEDGLTMLMDRFNIDSKSCEDFLSYPTKPKLSAHLRISLIIAKFENSIDLKSH